jgi:hypothetical protein
MQTSYSYNMPVAQAGQLADIRDNVIESFSAQGVIGLGLAVVAGTDKDRQGKLPAAASDVFRGVSVADQALEQGYKTGVVQYADTSTVPVLRRGQIWVTVAVNVSADDAAFFVPTTGQFSNTANAAANGAVPGGVFRSSGTAGGLAKLEINLPR